MKRIIFAAREVLQIAIKNEKDGEAFYRKIAEGTGELPVRRMFLFLARQEPRHASIFEQMLSESDRFESITSDPDEYTDYMVAYYTADILFSSTLTDQLPVSADPISVLDFGIRRELDSITYYMQAKDLVPESEAALIEKIIEEEREHFLKLSGLKRRYLKKLSSTTRRKSN